MDTQVHPTNADNKGKECSSKTHYETIFRLWHACIVSSATARYVAAETDECPLGNDAVKTRVACGTSSGRGRLYQCFTMLSSARIPQNDDSKNTVPERRHINLRIKHPETTRKPSTPLLPRLVKSRAVSWNHAGPNGRVGSALLRNTSRTQASKWLINPRETITPINKKVLKANTAMASGVNDACNRL